MSMGNLHNSLPFVVPTTIGNSLIISIGHLILTFVSICANLHLKAWTQIQPRGCGRWAMMGRSETKLVSCQKPAWQPRIWRTPIRLLFASVGFAAIGFGQAFAESPATSDDSATPIQEIV